MDQASASPAASCAHNPAAPRTSSSCSQSADQSQTVGPPPARSSPRSEPHSEPVHIVPRPSSPALCQSDAKGYLLPDYYSGATGIPGRFSEGLLLRRLDRDSHGSPPRFMAALATRFDPKMESALPESFTRKPYDADQGFLGSHDLLALRLDSK